MSRIRARDTKVELIVRRQLFRRGHRFRVNAAWLAGKPDVVFTKAKLAVLVDGDFWHGWKFDRWSAKLAPYWRDKITRNRVRDRRCVAQLRRQGWSVMRVWEHEVEENIERCIARIERTLDRLRSA